MSRRKVPLRSDVSDAELDEMLGIHFVEKEPDASSLTIPACNSRALFLLLAVGAAALVTVLVLVLSGTLGDGGKNVLALCVGGVAVAIFLLSGVYRE